MGGATHLTVDSSTLADAVRMLEENTKDAKVLREKASDVDHRIMCPSCLAAYVSEVIDEVRAHFALSKLLDDPCATHAFFDVSEFMHRRLTTNTTFAKTMCHEIASRAHLQCRQRDRSILGWLRAKLGGWHTAQVPSLDEPPGTRLRG